MESISIWLVQFCVQNPNQKDWKRQEKKKYTENKSLLMTFPVSLYPYFMEDSR